MSGSTPAISSEREPIHLATRPAPLPRLLAPALRDDGLGYDQPLPVVRRGGAQLGKRWWFSLPIFGVVSVVVLLVVSVIGAVVVGSDRVQRDAELQLFVGMMAQLLGTVVAYVVIFAVERRRHPVEVRLSGFAAGIFGGLFVGSFLLWVCVGVLIALGAWRIVGIDPSYSPWADLLMMGLGAGIAEEIMFRGMLLRLLERGLGTWLAVGVSSVAFGFVHLQNPDATLIGAGNVAVAGLMLGLMYVHTRSLWFVIAVHAAWNVTQGPVVGSVVSGSRAARGYLVSEPIGSALLNGGAFGLEGSVLTLIILLAVCAGLAWSIRRRALNVQPTWTRRRVNPIMRAARAGHQILGVDPTRAASMGERTEDQLSGPTPQ